MPSRLKELILEETAAHYRGVENMIFVGYRGLSAGQIAEFRQELRKEQVHIRVVRNRIAVRALADLGRPEDVKGLFDGPTAIMDGEDPVVMAKVAMAFAKRHPRLEVKGGVVEGQVLSAAEAAALARMESRPELLARIAGTVLGVGGRLVAAATAPAGRVAGALKAMADKQEEVEDAAGSPEPQAA